MMIRILLMMFFTMATHAWGQKLLFKPSQLAENRLERREENFTPWMSGEEKALYWAHLGGTGTTTLYIECNQEWQSRMITTTEMRYGTTTQSFKRFEDFKNHHAIYIEKEYELLSLSTTVIDGTLFYNAVWVKEDSYKDARRLLKKIGISVAEVEEIKED